MDRLDRPKRHPRILVLAAGLTICCLAGSPAIADDADAAGPWTLRWANGDELAGHLVSASGGQLIWHSAVLARPVALDLGVLQSVTGPDPDALDGPLDGWRFSLSTGDVIHGNIIRIEPRHVVIDSARHGRVTSRREWIEQFARTAHRHPVDLIKAAGSGWQSLDPAWKQRGSGLADWTTDEPRVIATSVPGARLFFPTELPERCQMEFYVECNSRLGFSLALGGIEHLKQRTGDLEIETWGDELVVQSASSTGEFEHLLRLSLQTKSVSLRVFWDRVEGRIFIYDKGGELIVDADVGPADKSAAKGVLVENKGEDLTIRMLRVGNWNGEQAPSVIVGQDRVRTVHGGEYYGVVTGPDADGMLLIDPPEGEARRVPLDAVLEIVLPPAATAEGPARLCELEFHDGTIIQGNLVSIDRGVASVAVPFFDDDFPVVLQGLRECTFTPTAQVAARDSSHVLEYQGLRLHGRLAPAETALGWLLVGSSDVIPLATDSSLRITRLEDSKLPAGESPQDTDVAYFVGGDQVPCRVERIGDQFVTLSTSLAPATKIPRSELQAVEFDVQSVAQLSSFTAPGWKTEGGKLHERTPERIVFAENAQISHPDLLRGGMCEFDVDWARNTQTLLFLSLSADGNSFVNSSQMFYLIVNENGILVETRSGRGAQRRMVSKQPRPSQPLTVRLEAAGQRINLVVNGDVLGTLQRTEPQAPMVGVTIGCQPMNARNNPQVNTSRLTISNIRTGRGDGLFRGAALTEIGREHIVTVPRSRRHHPPSAVLVAQNGDLLRGELVAFNRTATAFRSRLEDVMIPSERLAGIVFLPEPADDVQPLSRPDGLVQVTLHNGVVLNLTPERVAGDEIVGTHPVLGPCHVNLSAIDELRTGELTSESRRRVFTEWTLVHSPEPIIPGGDGSPGFGTFSKLVGERAEDFSLPLLDGEPFRLSDHQDKVVVLDFWATWCGPCIQALPQLTSATAAYSPDDVLFVAVNQRENEALIRQFQETRGWDFPVALDADGAIGALYQVEGLPQTVVIGRGGRIEHVHLGVSPNLEAELTETLGKLLTTDSTDSAPSGQDEE